MNPAHLLEQAQSLIQAPARGAPRQADKRRAISAAYYAVFHAVARQAADTLIGGVHRHDARYALVYRSVAHGKVKTICQEALKPTPAAMWRAYWPQAGFGADLQAFSRTFLNLLQSRHAADYDPSFRVNTAEAQDAIDQALDALQRLERAPAGERNLFVTLLLCNPQG